MLLKELIKLFIEERLDYDCTVILTGSCLKKLNEDYSYFKSDIDLVLIHRQDSLSKISYFNNLKFDITSWRQNKSIEVILDSVLGKNKVLNSLQDCMIVKDDLKLANQIINLSNRLYSLVLNDRFISYRKLSILMHNINSAIEDVDHEKNSFVSNVSKHHLLQTILTYLINIYYPFQAYGKFMGNILNQKIDFNNIFFIESFNHFKLNPSILTILNENYSISFFEEERKKIVGFQLTDDLIKKIKKQKGIIFYFGFNNLMDDTSILFIKQKDIKSFKIMNKLIEPVDITINLTLGLGKLDQNIFNDILSKVSILSLDRDFNLRLEFIQHILMCFLTSVSKESFINTIKANVFLDIIQKKNRKKKINIKLILVELQNIKLKEINGSPNKNMNSILEELIVYNKKISRLLPKEDLEKVFKTNFFRLVRAMRLSLYDVIYNFRDFH